MSERFNDTPCGQCDAGIYDVVPVLIGLKMFRNCASRKEALESAPRCKRDPSHICFGARDWIVSQPFPMTDADIAEIMECCAT